MKVNNVLSNIAKTKPMQKFYKWASDPLNDRFLNNNLPQVETILSTACYIWSTAKQKNIDDERKKLLQIQNVGSGAVGLCISSWANKKVGKLGEDVIKHLDTTKVDPKSIRQISTGIRVGLPILTTAFCMRFLIPSLLAAFSGKMMDRIREKEKKGINVNA